LPIFTLKFTPEASKQLLNLEQNKGLEKRLKSVRKALGRLESNPRHPSLNTHEYEMLSSIRGKKVFEAYAENKTPAAYRIFWEYGPRQGQITILSIVPHP
jgi:hypothetical protein